jgi:hypothetical protein
MAAKARAKAEAMMDYEARRTMLEVAELWDTMAKNAERMRAIRGRSSHLSTATVGQA